MSCEKSRRFERSDQQYTALPKCAALGNAGFGAEIARGLARRLVYEDGGRAVLMAGTEAPDVVELWDRTPGPGDVRTSEAHGPGTRELIAVLHGGLRLRVGQREEPSSTHE